MKVLLISPFPLNQSKLTWQYSVDLAKLCRNIQYDIISDQGCIHKGEFDSDVYLRFDSYHILLVTFQILKLIKQKSYDAVHFQYEHKIFGSIHKTYIILLLSSLITVFGKRFVVTIHNTPNKEDVANFSHLWNNTSIDYTNNIKTNILWLSYLCATQFIGIISTRVHVHEDFQKNRLMHQYGINKNKIVVVPHHVYSTTPKLTKKHIKSTKTSMLFFGYLAPYKGLDDLIYSFIRNYNASFELIICGSLPNYQNKSTQSRLNSWHKQLLQATKKYKNIIWKEAIKNEDIPHLFESVDYIVMPYKSVFGSSGVLSWALKLHKRIILSKQFANSNLEEIPTFEEGLKHAIDTWNEHPDYYNSILDSALALRNSDYIEQKMIEMYER